MHLPVPGIKKALAFLGPSLIMATSLAGRGYVDILTAGGNFGFSLVWVIIAALIFKYALIDGISRYTLATGDHIFVGLQKVPGPKNWEIIFIFIIYLLEMVGYGAMLLSCAVFLSYLLPFSVPTWLIATIFVLIIISVLFKRSYRVLEYIVLVIVVSMTVGILYLISVIHIPWVYATLPWAYPPVSSDNLSSVISLITTAGSGLTLLFISIWLLEKIKTVPSKEYYEENLSAVRTGNVIAFLLVGLFSIGLIIIGFSAFQGENFFDGVVSAFGDSPQNITILIIISVITLFGVVLTGIDGRARAITRVLVDNVTMDFSVMNVYHNLLFLLCTIMLITIFLGNPTDIVQWIPAIGNIMFAITGFMILYLDLRLPVYARGGLVWVVIMVLGSGSCLLIALLKEGFFLKDGIPLLEGVFVVLFLCYLFTQTQAFKNAIQKRLDYADIIWIVIFCSAISIYGSYRGILGDDFIIQFSDFGAIVAGLMGGPVAGICTGIIGGLYLYSLGGWTAIPGIIAILMAGLISGMAAIRWKYRLTYSRVILLSVFIESLHILVIRFVYGYFIEQDISGTLEIMRLEFFPMLVTNTAGIILFLYLVHDRNIPESEDEDIPAYGYGISTATLIRKSSRIMLGVLALIILIVAIWSLIPVMFPDDRALIHLHYDGTRGDFSSSDSFYRGYLKADSQYDFSSQEFTGSVMNELDLMYRNPGKRPNLIITPGNKYLNHTLLWSEMLPHTHIIAIDQAGPSRQNIRYEEISPYGASYLAGILAATISHNGKVAVIAGTKSRAPDGFISGFTDGVTSVNSSVIVSVRYVSETNDGSFDEQRARQIADDLIQDGNDIIVGLAGYANIGIIHAIQGSDSVYFIGGESDQTFLDPKRVLASVIKKVDLLVFEGIGSEINQSFTPGRRITGLAEGYSDLSLNPRFHEYQSLITSWKDRAETQEESFRDNRTNPAIGDYNEN